MTAQGHNLIVRVAHRPLKTKSGIVLVDLSTSEGHSVGQDPSATQEALVVSIGHLVKLSVLINDRIVYDKFAGTVINTRDEGEFLVLPDESVIAVLGDAE